MHAQMLLAAALVVAFRLANALFVVTGLNAATELTTDTLGGLTKIPMDVGKDLRPC